MLVLALPRDLVEAALLPVEQRLARRPDGWSSLAARGKLRRLLGDRGGLEDLRTAAELYLRVHEVDPSLLTPANLYRLAGDARATGLLEQLREDARGGLLVETCFLLGDDAGGLAALAAGDLGQRQRAVAQLSAGRATADVALLDEALAFFGRAARLERTIATGGMNGHDWLEIALVTRAKVSGAPSDRLVEL